MEYQDITPTVANTPDQDDIPDQEPGRQPEEQRRHTFRDILWTVLLVIIIILLLWWRPWSHHQTAGIRNIGLATQSGQLSYTDGNGSVHTVDLSPLMKAPAATSYSYQLEGTDLKVTGTTDGTAHEQVVDLSPLVRPASPASQPGATVTLQGHTLTVDGTSLNLDSLVKPPRLSNLIGGNGIALSGDVQVYGGGASIGVVPSGITIAGDVTGNLAAATITSLAGTPLSSATPLAGQALIFNGSSWAAATLATSPSVGNLTSTGSLNIAGGTGAVVGSGVSVDLPSVGAAGSYGSGLAVPVLTTDAYGRVTAVSTTSIPTASVSQAGILSSSDYSTFAAKQATLSGGTGITISGTTITNGGVTSLSSANAGTGLVIGGTATNPTFSLATVGTAATYGSGNSVPVFVTDAYGRVVSVTATTISGLTASNLSSTAGITNGQLQNPNFSVTAGTGLSGGGSAGLGNNVTLSLPNIGTSGSYGSATSIPVVTTDAQGRVASVTSTAIPTASGSTAGLLAASDYSSFSNYATTKQNVLPVGSASQYLRGDQVLATLNTSVVPEGTNQYFTSARFNSAFALQNTDALSEGIANLYFTNSRADARINIQKGVANGVATLDATGKVPNSQLPAITATNTYVVASQSAMLALSASQGDVAVRTDINKTYILQQGPPNVLSNWIEVLTPGSPVQSVNGQTGTVSLLTTDITEGSNQYFTDLRARAAISKAGGTPLTYNSSTGVIGITQASGSSSGYLSSADYSLFGSKQDSLTTGTGIAISGSTITNTGLLGLDSSNAGSGITIGGSLTSPAIGLTSVGTAGSYGSASTIPVFSTDAQGRVTGVTNTAISGLTASNLSASADIANSQLKYSSVGVTAGTGLTGGGTTSLGGSTTLSLSNVGTAGTYGSAVSIPVITTDAQGRVTAVASTAIPTASNTQSGLLSSGDYVSFAAKQSALTFGNIASSDGSATITNGTNATVGPNVNISIATASTSQKGLLSSTDWTTFNNKENALTFNGYGMFSRTGNTINANTSCSNGQMLAYDGTAWVCTTPLSGSFITNATAQQTNANFNIQSASAGSVTAVISGATGQTADILDLRNSAGTNLASISASGAVSFQNSANSAAAFAVNDASGANILTIDSTNHLAKILTSSATNAGLSILNSDGTTALEIRAGGSALFNTFVGTNSGLSNSTGGSNTALGVSALRNNTTAGSNTAVGFNALSGNTTGGANTGLGFNALRNNTNGHDSVAVGSAALLSNTTGVNNTATGSGALSANTSGLNNVANGTYSLKANTTGNYNVAVGTSSLYFNTTGFNNSALGTYAMYSNTTGTNNAASGMNSLYSNTTGNYNLANGTGSLLSNTTGGSNSANGASAMYYNTTGSNNTADGANALYYNSTGSNNTGSGANTLRYSTLGSKNTTLGANSAINFVQNTGANLTVGSVTTGAANTNMFNVPSHGYAVGTSACFMVNSTGTMTAPLLAGAINCFNVYDANNFSFYGTITSSGSGTITLTPNYQYSNSTAIGSNSTITANNQITLGDSSVMTLTTTAGIQQSNGSNNNSLLGQLGLGTATPGFQLDVLGSGANGTTVAQFKNAGGTTCTVQPGGTGFACSSDSRLKTDVNTISSPLDLVSQLRGVTYHWNSTAGGDTGLQYGFIAQEVQKVIPSAVGVGANGYLVLNPNAITPVLVNAVNDLNDKVNAIPATVLSTLADADAVTIKGDLTIGHDLYVNGHLQVGDDTSGTASVLAGKTNVHVAFKQAYPVGHVPKVVASQQSLVTGLDYAVQNVTETGFDIAMHKQSQPVSFSWIALAGGRSDIDVSQ